MATTRSKTLFDDQRPSVATTPEIDRLLNDGAPVAIGVSGGKDSSAVAFATVAHLDRIGHSGPRVLIHSDPGIPKAAAYKHTHWVGSCRNGSDQRVFDINAGAWLSLLDWEEIMGQIVASHRRATGWRIERAWGMGE